MDRPVPPEIRSVDGVRNTYDRIAAHFAQTRRHPWPAVERFLDGRAGAIGVDIGCGNGRHLPLLSARVDRALGVDLSARLLREAEPHLDRCDGAALLQGAATWLPLADGTADLALHIATVHHLPSRERRIAALDELARVLAPDGRALVSAWSVTHDRFDRETAFDTVVDWTLPDGTTIPRYYHIYDREAFADDLASSACRVERIFEEAGNWYGVLGG